MISISRPTILHHASLLAMALVMSGCLGTFQEQPDRYNKVVGETRTPRLNPATAEQTNRDVTAQEVTQDMSAAKNNALTPDKLKEQARHTPEYDKIKGSANSQAETSDDNKIHAGPSPLYYYQQRQQQAMANASPDKTLPSKNTSDYPDLGNVPEANQALKAQFNASKEQARAFSQSPDSRQETRREKGAVPQSKQQPESATSKGQGNTKEINTRDISGGDQENAPPQSVSNDKGYKPAPQRGVAQYIPVKPFVPTDTKEDNRNAGYTSPDEEHTDSPPQHFSKGEAEVLSEQTVESLLKESRTKAPDNQPKSTSKQRNQPRRDAQPTQSSDYGQYVEEETIESRETPSRFTDSSDAPGSGPYDRQNAPVYSESGARSNAEINSFQQRQEPEPIQLRPLNRAENTRNIIAESRYHSLRSGNP